MSFWAELRRRQVVRVGALYAVVGWLLVQMASAFESALGLPDWFDTLVVALLAIGFPLALVLAWAFELTPEGVKRSTSVGGSPPSQRFATDAVLITAVIALLGVSLFQVLRPRSPASSDETAAAGAAAAGTLSIAVLPFVNMSSDAEQEYFSDGLSEELLNQLAQIEELEVIGRTSSFAFKGQNVDLRSIGEQLNAAHVLEGSVRKSEDRLRITAQLIDAASGVHLWSETYDRRLDDVFAIQDEIARSVADALSVTLGVRAASADASLTADVEAYDLYLRARAQIARFAPEDFARAAELFREALALDPGFSRARAGLVHAAFYSMIYVPERRAEAERAIEEAVAQGRARAPDDWATQFAVAVLHIQRYEWADAEDAFARVAARAPASVPEVDELRSLMVTTMGRVEDALEILQASMSSDPLSANRSWQLQFVLALLGRAEEAEAEYQRSRDLPGADAREDIAHWALLRIWNGGDAALIEQRFDTFLNRQTVPTPWIANVRAVYGNPEAALAIIRAALDDPASQDSTRLQFVASYAAHYGDTELALTAARRAFVDLRGPNMAALWWPDMAVARRLPAFKDLVREIGLVDYWRTIGDWGDFCRPVGVDDFECE